VQLHPGWEAALATQRTWDGQPLPAALRSRLEVAARMVTAINAELTRARATQRQATRTPTTVAATTARQLTTLRGIGERFAWVMATEVCSRELRNRRQVGALTGFTAVPFHSGTHRHDQGISRAGVASLRSLAVETAWVWLRWQPDSALTQWFNTPVAQAARRARQIGIVAVARKLVIALWRYSRDGTVPAGAVQNRATA
jgi:transposase